MFAQHYRGKFPADQATKLNNLLADCDLHQKALERELDKRHVDYSESQFIASISTRPRLTQS